MKKLINSVRFYLVGAMMMFASLPARAEGGGANDAICVLLRKLEPLFTTLSILAFVGAGFIIAGWAWGFISAGKVDMADVKTKGIGMLVGFVLLFAIGAVLQFLLSASSVNGILGCEDELMGMFGGGLE